MVDRYNVDVEKNENGYWEGVLFLSANGEYVRHSDYVRLQEQVEALRKELTDQVNIAIRTEAKRADATSRAEAAEAERDRLREENERLREACRIARLHAPIVRLAPERRHTIAVLDAALQKEPQP